jgi:CHAT domain
VETIDAGDVPLEVIIEQLLSPAGLKRLVGDRALACFALVRPALAPSFFERLVQNVETIDATMRNHVAFIVFYGNKSSLLRSHPDGYGRYYEYHVDGLSTSGGSVRLDDSQSAHEINFSDQLTDALRYNASRRQRSTVAKASELAVTYLSKHFGIKEASLPCLLFLDGSELDRPIIVSLSRTETLESLYLDVLAPLSDEFARLEYYWNLRRDLDWHVRDQRRAESTISQYAAERKQLTSSLQAVQRRLDECRNQSPESASLLNNLNEERKLLGDLCRKYKNAKSIEDRIALSIGTEDFAKIRSIETRLLTFERRKKDLYKQNASDEEREALRTVSSTVNRLRGKLGNAASRPYAKAINRLREIDANLKQHGTRAETLEQTVADIEQKIERLALDKTRAEKTIFDGVSFDLETKILALEVTKRSLILNGYSDSYLDSATRRSVVALRVMQDRELLGSAKKVKERPGDGLKILFLAANPVDTDRLDLEEELRSIENELRAVKYRDKISFIAKHAVRADDLVRLIRSERPNVIHFSGHGSTDGIVLRDERGEAVLVRGVSLSRLLKERSVDLVVLNACYSQEQARPIEANVKAVIGTRQSVGDEAARRFSTAFYRTLGDGHSIREAFRDGRDAVDLHNLEDVFQIAGNPDIVMVK